MNKHKLFIPMATFAIVAGLYATNANLAQAQDSTKEQRSPVVQKLIERFNLNAAEVDKVVAEVHDAKKAEHKVKLEDRLNQAVKAGKITEAQKSQILAKMEEMKNQKEGWKDLTPEQRQEKMKAHHEAMKKWQEETGINLGEILGKGRMGKPGMHMKGFDKGQR